ncbi:MAG: hypothetical protein KC589_05680 [Nanoarchaeota archaeon]|nr:hypothetical protein [Nanoarchaeota archaeon]
MADYKSKYDENGRPLKKKSLEKEELSEEYRSKINEYETGVIKWNVPLKLILIPFLAGFAIIFLRVDFSPIILFLYLTIFIFVIMLILLYLRFKKKILI